MAATPPLPPLDAGAGRELGRFLTARRARLQPADVGLPDGVRRRVPGLRREEVASLAGVSPAYYTRLEQGEGGRVSDEVAMALARTLRLTRAETDHLMRLVDPRGQRLRETDAEHAVRPALQGLLDAVVDVPAVIVGRRSDILAWNALGSAVFGDLDRLPLSERNWARLVFLHPQYRDLFVDWVDKAADVVGQLRMDAGRHPGDARLAALVGELAVASTTFAQLWAQQDIRERCRGRQSIRHPEVGVLELNVETFRVAGEEDASLVTYHADPGSLSRDRLLVLGSWAQVGPVDVAERRHVDR